MTAQLDDHPLEAVAATRAARTTEAFAYVHPPTELNGEHAPVPVFDVIAEPMTGRLNMVGELDLAGSRQIRDAVTATQAYCSADVVVDLAHLRFIDARGIGLLIGLRDELAEHGATLRIVNADARIRESFPCVGSAPCWPCQSCHEQWQGSRGAEFMTGLLPSRVRHHTKSAAASDRATNVPRELSGGAWWRFTETDLAAFSPRALEVHVDVADRRITVCGELDLASIDTLTDVVALLIEHNPGSSTIDLCGLSAIDAAGFEYLVGINRRLTAMGVRLSVAGAPPELRLIFDIAGLFGILETG